ncbi:hypothetical protein CDD81_2249 [Ophiocordyceps australis]|uniref:Uncharacterized protein n=1 Tax=Ophiocordyceps australis TaxID=1399860 RepID=A0A2C5XB21_9HYPO|nr:hypothetical protein CDD81_2249 [Ophiocordyceps australis]
MSCLGAAHHLLRKTGACVPNSFTMPLLAPVYDTRVCPYPPERWEIRTRPLGCHVSTITTFSVAGAVAVALVLGGIVLLATRIAAGRCRPSTTIPNQNPRDFWRQGLTPVHRHHGERDPLLPERQW